MFPSNALPVCGWREEHRVVPDALVLLEALDVVANVPDDELSVRAAADQDGRLERMPRKRLFKLDSQFRVQVQGSPLRETLLGIGEKCHSKQKAAYCVTVSKHI